MELSQIYVNDQPYDLNNNLALSLFRGSAWNNLFYQAEGYNINVEKIDLNTLILAYEFAIHEIKLYLYTHPDCTNAMNDLKLLKENLEKIKKTSGDVDVVL